MFETANNLLDNDSKNILFPHLGFQNHFSVGDET